MKHHARYAVARDVNSMAQKFNPESDVVDDRPVDGETNIVIGMACLGLLSMRTKTKCRPDGLSIGDRPEWSIDGHLAQ